MKKIVLIVTSLLLVNFIKTADVQANSQPEVQFQAMAENEIQPKLLHDKQGRTHLIYFKMEDLQSRKGHLYYKKYISKLSTWSEPIRISTKAYRRPDVIATAKMTIDGQGRLHVAWLDQHPTAFLYSRSDALVEKFETPRVIITENTDGAEANATLSVYGNKMSMIWMAGHDENLRTVYSMTSNDNGETFGPETRIGDQSLGGCACCAYASAYTNQGELLVAYRSAANGNNRDMQLLSVMNGDKNTVLVDKWQYNACPVSTNNMIQDHQNNTWLTWETKGKIYTSMRKDKLIKPVLVSSLNSTIRQKHPSMAINKQGYKLIAWSQGDGYFSGGELKVKLYDPEFEELAPISTEAMHPVLFSYSSATSLADGSFLVLY